MGLLGTAAAPSAVADQSDAGQLRVTIGAAPRAQANGFAAGPASNATCTINKITVNRYSECEWVSIHVDVIKIINGKPELEGTVDFDVKHQMTLKVNSANWSEKFHVSKARTTRAAAVSPSTSPPLPQAAPRPRSTSRSHILSSSAADGTVGYTTSIAPKKINPKAKTTYAYTFTKPGYSPGSVTYNSAVYRCDNYYGSSKASRAGCAVPDVPTGVSMVGLARIDEGIRKLRASGGHYGDPNGGKPLHWMINKKQEDANRKAVCPSSAPADMKRAGRTSCDEYPFASSREGGTHLPAKQREITWVKVQENKSQGGRITAWRGQMHVMDGDPFYVIA